MISVPNYKALTALPLSQIDDIAYVSSEDRYYVLKNSGWVCTDLQKAPEGLNYEMTQYDMNKQIMAQLPNLIDDALEEKRQLLDDWYFNYGANKYYMLLCKELSYYTIVRAYYTDIPDKETFGDVIIDCLINLSNNQIKAIDKNEDGAIEAWFIQDDEAYCALLFDYTSGVIELGV